jgi:hypothetical protein
MRTVTHTLDPEVAARCRREVDRAVDGYRSKDREPLSFAELLKVLRNDQAVRRYREGLARAA